MGICINIAVVLVGVNICVWLIWYLETTDFERKYQRNRETDKEDPRENLAAVIFTFNNTKRIASHTDKSHYPIKFSFSQFISLGTVVAAFAAVCVYGHQLSVMQKTLNEMQSEQRAWISLTKDSGIEGISLNQGNDLRANIRFDLQNTGKNPAVDVFVNSEMSIGTLIPYGSMPAWQKVVCGQSTGYLGTTMFPSSPEPIFIISTPLTPTEINDHQMIGNVLAPVIAACIVYRDAVTKELHHTPLAYRIRMRAALKPGRGCCAIVTADLPIKGEDLVFQIWVRGNLPPD